MCPDHPGKSYPELAVSSLLKKKKTKTHFHTKFSISNYIAESVFTGFVLVCLLHIAVNFPAVNRAGGRPGVLY